MCSYTNQSPRSPRQSEVWTSWVSAGHPLSPGERVRVRAGQLNLLSHSSHRTIQQAQRRCLASPGFPSPRPSPSGRGRSSFRLTFAIHPALRFSLPNDQPIHGCPRQSEVWTSCVSAGHPLSPGERVRVRAGLGGSGRKEAHFVARDAGCETRAPGNRYPKTSALAQHPPHPGPLPPLGRAERENVTAPCYTRRVGLRFSEPMHMGGLPVGSHSPRSAGLQLSLLISVSFPS
jgi:hypothetical protein